MGVGCHTICSPHETSNQIQPDTDTIKSRPSAPTYSNTPSIISDTETPTQPKKEHSIIEDFHEAVQQGNNNKIKFYLDEYPSYDLLNNTVLHTAVKHKQYAVMQYMLEEGAFVNAKVQSTGNTALHLAATLNDIESVKILLKFDADAYITNNNKATALSIAQQYEFKDILNEFGEESKTSEINSPPSEFSNNFLSPSDLDATDILSDSPGIISDTDETNESYLMSCNTTRLGTLTDDILDDIQATMVDSMQKLPTLEGWLDKKQSAPPYSWLRRWVVVKDGHLLWSDRQISIDKGLTKEEKKRWNNCISLRKIASVSAIAKKKQRRFKVGIKNNRDYIWRAKTTKIRDRWANGLKQHVDHSNMTSVYNQSTTKLELP